MHVQIAEMSLYTPADYAHGMQPSIYTGARLGGTANSTVHRLALVAQSCAQ